MLLTASEDKTARVWEAATGKQLAELTGHTQEIYSAWWHPDGSKILTASSDYTARVWDAVSGKLISTFREHATPDGSSCSIVSVSWHPDGSRVLTYSNSVYGKAFIWDLATGKTLSRPGDGLTGKVDSASWSPDGSKLVIGIDDGTILIRDARTGSVISRLHVDDNQEALHSWSPDGSRLVTGGWGDDLIRVWDWELGIELLALPGKPGPAGRNGFSPDGSRLMTYATNSETVLVHDGRPINRAFMRNSVAPLPRAKP
jgi:WD40 repeat protein